MDLPHFAYHPDPLASGSIVASDAVCRCCGQSRGYIYTGPAYCEDDLEEALCPWCIADGSAHDKFDATFTDEAGFPDGIAPSVVEEVAQRTPGFSSWQQGRWLTCCDDAAAFLEPAGHAEIAARYPRADGMLITYIVQQMGISGGAAHQLYRALDRDKGPTAYFFECRHCGNQPAYIDSL
jgi:uncharacterized protein CbrC (UPF0167 family)